MMDLDLLLRTINHVRQIRKHERWTRRQLEEYQAKELRRLRDFAYAQSPFYQRFHKGLFGCPLSELPVLTKSTVMENFDELVTDRSIHLEEVRVHMANDREGKRFLNRYWITATSGSTGSPGIFLFNADEWATVVATLGRTHEWAGIPVIPRYRMRMASVASVHIGSPWHISAQVAKSLQSKWMSTWMPTLSLDAAQPLTEIVRQLEDWQPHLLGGYASMMRILAEEQLAGRLHLHPDMIVTVAEVLTDETRRRIQAAWGHLPFNTYGATEAGTGLAAEAVDHLGLYVFEDNAIFEVVDSQYRSVGPGEYGDRVLITTLFSRTQPLIRYELTDSVRLVLDPTSRLPFARIDSIQGRTEDILHLPAVAGGTVAVHPITFHHVLDSLPVSGWQVLQQQQGLRVLLSMAQPNVNDAQIVDTITRNLTAQSVIAPQVVVQHVDVIAKDATGKAPLIKAYRK